MTEKYLRKGRSSCKVYSSFLIMTMEEFEIDWWQRAARLKRWSVKLTERTERLKECSLVGERVVRVDEEDIVSCHRHHKPSAVLEISSKIVEE